MPEYEPYVVSNDLLDDPPALRERAASDGYLFFRGLLPSEPLLDVRRRILEICTEFGWLEPGTGLLDAVARRDLLFQEGDPVFMEVYDRVQRLEAFHRLAHHPAIVGMFEKLFGEPVLLHPRNIARIIFPRSEGFTTPPHQDYVHIQGTPDTWTCWFPLGDCPRNMGGLEILEGSHGRLLPVHSAKGAGGLGVDTEGVGRAWRGGDFAAGDYVVFHSHNVHRGVPNVSGDRFRLSCDFRYQAVSQPVHQSSLLPHHARLTWDMIYDGWTDPSLQYYWKQFDLNLAEWSNDVRQLAY